MKLHFHGADYEANQPTAEVKEGEVGGTYRGRPWKLHHLIKAQNRRRSSSVHLTYRGIPYDK